METKLNCIQAAWNLCDENLAGRSRSQIAEDLELLAQYELPWHRKLAITVHFLSDVVDSPEPRRFVDALWPEKIDEAWVGSFPKMGTLVGEVYDTEEGSNRREDFKEQLLEGFFCSKILRLVATVESRDSQIAMVSLFRDILSRWDVRETAMDDFGAEALELIILTCRGLFALLYPVPLKFNSGVKDVNFLWPTTSNTKTLSFMRRNPKFGNRMNNELTRGSAGWLPLLRAFRDAVGGETACATDIFELLQEAEEANSQIEAAQETKNESKLNLGLDMMGRVISKYCAKAPTWKSSCRPDCLVEIHDVVEPFIKTMADKEVSKAVSMEGLQILTQLKTLATDMKLTELAQQLGNAITTRMESSQAVRLTAIVNDGLTTVESADMLLGSWRAAKNSEGLHGVTRDIFVDARPKVMRLLTLLLRTAGVYQDGMASALELAKLYTTEPQVANPDETIAAADKKSMLALFVWTTMVAKLKAAVAEPVGAETARKVIALHIATLTHKTSKLNQGFDVVTQGYLNDVTSYLADLENQSRNHICTGGMADFKSTGELLSKTLADCRAVAGLSPAADGQVWHTVGGGIPASGDNDRLLQAACTR